MKVMVAEDKSEGFMALMGKQVTLFCAVYIYTGKLVGVNDTCVKLENPAIVYETGPFTDKKWKDAQGLPNNTLYIQTAMVEAFGEVK